MIWDLVVVGASFAGLAAARAAALAGCRVLLMEKKPAAGANLHSTGIIVKDAVDSVQWLQQVPSTLTRRIEGVRLYAPNLCSVDLFAPGYYFWATDTGGLLDWMVESVRRVGVEVQLGTLFTDATWVQDAWRIDIRDAEPIRARYLVGADGPHSRVAKALGLSSNQQFLYGVEHEYQYVDMASNLLHCFIDRQLAPGYIGWGLVGVKACQIGLARRIPARARQEGTRRVDMAGFVRKIAGHIQVHDLKPDSIRAGMIPCGGVLPRVACHQALLVGDAAGMVSPVTAGGIHTALRHGAAAGAAVAQFAASRGPDPALSLPATYPRYLQKRALRWLFDHAQTDWMFNLMLNTSAMRRAAELVYFHRRGRG